jgi:hypothetical protein
LAVSPDTAKKSFAMNIDAKLYPSAQAVAAAGIEMATLKNWLSREPAVLLLHKSERVGTGASTRFQFSFRRIMQIAIIAELVRLGFAPRHAGTLAASFTDIGEAYGGWSEEDIRQAQAAARAPGMLFKKGLTVLVANADTKEYFAELVNVTSSTSAFKLMTQFGKAAAIININEIDTQVRAALGASR